MEDDIFKSLVQQSVKTINMLKFIIAILLTALVAFACTLFFPWWSIAIAAFVVSLVMRQSALKSFLSGFIALFLTWGIYAAVIDSRNDHILATKVAGILPLGGSYIAIIIVTALVGALVAGLAALTASFIRSVQKK